MDKILHINVNFSKTMISIGKQNGYELYRYQDLQRTSLKEYDGGIGPIDVLETSNIVGLSGGGFFPSFQLDNVIIIDDCTGQIRAQIQLPSQVRSLKFFKEYLIAVLDYKIFVMSFFSQIKVLKVVKTSLNIKENIDLNIYNSQYQLASINNLYLENDTLISKIQILDCKNLSQKTIEIGNNELYKIRLNEIDESSQNVNNWIACVTRNSNEIQIYDINTSKCVRKCSFNGQNIISSFCFDQTGQFFAVLESQKGKLNSKLSVYTFWYFQKPKFIEKKILFLKVIRNIFSRQLCRSVRIKKNRQIQQTKNVLQNRYS